MNETKRTWEHLEFLVGTWTGDSEGRPGRGTGEFVFESGLDGRLLTRRSHTEYPAAEGRPAVHHDDVTIVYRDPMAGGIRAEYVDNEDHVIHYRVQVSEDGALITFLSDPVEGAPQFRITYKRLTADSADVAFAIAPPGQPLTPYVSGPAYRVKG